ncbi:hypothetical protein, partial [Escherichia albertii]|uniref:hypothetical protein n=2 Tax=Escherichia albertii TaxID=208962 RepID=UPI001EE466C7
MQLVYKINYLHIKWLTDYYRFFMNLCLRKNTKFFYDMDSLAPNVSFFGGKLCSVGSQTICLNKAYRTTAHVDLEIVF